MTLPSHQQTQRLDHLFTASYRMFTACPSLSRYYMNEFQNTLTEYELTSATERLSCSSCGQILVPGLNSQVRLISKKRQHKPNKSLIRSMCFTCRHTKIYHGSYKKKIPTEETAPPVIEQGKKKKNKGKKNNLKALLSKPKPNTSTTGGLSDFLSSL
ncbi:uncharacterized protein B0P05DRAFT_581151 [Gilbertella persicaria]|uniref:uncharacterized protein n=1 Tax=Gilbertella persicaria TaxID=101096 RepID=UPI00221ECC5F|nr:uncharacterized protein B0P05DRAFT_581151 [Gilbertella persicaria]KAI8062787.1 hypothetical protein B0P05DRAFT_581151 [Gilbertella persicaria]